MCEPSSLVQPSLLLHDVLMHGVYLDPLYGVGKGIAFQSVAGGLLVHRMK